MDQFDNILGINNYQVPNTVANIVIEVKTFLKQ